MNLKVFNNNNNNLINIYNIIRMNLKVFT
jgi:hypothetical protein